MAGIDVIIPFYQREKGPLSRAVASIFAQTGRHQIRIIVIDDSSPSPADGELASLSCPADVELLIRRQPNGGPGAARNSGLDLASAAYVAFLDSDDLWLPDHLDRATAILDAGADLFFSNWLKRDGAVGFDKCAPLPLENRLSGDLGFLADPLVDQFFTDKVMPLTTPTLVFRRDRFAGLRFPTDFHIGEDGVFFLEMAFGGPRVGVSLTPTAQLGYGVNIYGGVRWNDPAAVTRSRNNLRYFERVYSRAQGHEALRGRVARNWRRERKMHLKMALRWIARGRATGLRALATWASAVLRPISRR